MPNKTHFLRIAGASLTSGVVDLTTTEENLNHQDVYKFRWNLKWSEASGDEPIRINKHFVVTKQSETLKLGTIRRRELLILRFVKPSAYPEILPPHFVVIGGTIELPRVKNLSYNERSE